MDAKKKKRDILPELLAAASPETLRNLLHHLAASQIEVRRECLEYLKMHVSLSSEDRKVSDGEAVLLLWSELAPDLDELNEYGGGDYGMEDHVAGLLYEIQEKLDGKSIDSEYRQELIDEVLPYIESGNAGLYEQGELLYEKGCLNLDNLSEKDPVNSEEDSRVCVMEYCRGKKGALDNVFGPFNINEPVKLLLVRVMLETSSVGVLPYMD